MVSSFHSRNFALIVLFSLLAGGIFCLWSVNVLSADKSFGSRPVDQMTLCGTDTQSHISARQGPINVVPQKPFNLLLLALLIVFITTTYKIRPRPPATAGRPAVGSGATSDRIDPIKQALARGIIQPKIHPFYTS